jgi:hypothetical protein
MGPTHLSDSSDIEYPAATFTATRDELLGGEPLLASAEIARDICRSADRTISVLAVTPARMRRIDGWLDSVGFVTHAAAPDPGRPLLGSVCDRDRAPALIREIVGSLAGEVADRPATAPADMPALRGLTPVTLPDGVDWIVVVSSASTRHDPTRLMLVGADGLLAGPVAALDRPVPVEPIEPDVLDARLAELVGAPPRSIRDLLIDD